MAEAYEIRIVGDASALIQASRQAQQALAQVGRAGTQQALRGVTEETDRLRIGYRDASSAVRIFVGSLASELNPSLAAAINQSRMLSFALLNFRNVLGAGTIGVLAAAAGAVEFYTSRAQRMADTQAKANLAAREFNTKELVTSIRQANVEMDALLRNTETRMTKFATLGGIGGGVLGFIFGGGPAGAVLGAGVGAVGGAALAKLLTGLSVSELQEAIRVYDEALGLLVPFEQRMARAAEAIAAAQQQAAQLRIRLAQREMLGRPALATEMFQDIQAAVEEQQLAELFRLRQEYQRELAVAEKSGENARLIVKAEFQAKELAMEAQHRTQRLQLATEYGQALLKVTHQAEEAAEAIAAVPLDLIDFLRDLTSSFTAGAGAIGSFSEQIRKLQQQLDQMASAEQMGLLTLPAERALSLLQSRGAAIGAPDDETRLLQAVRTLQLMRRREQLTGPAEQVGPRPGEQFGPLGPSEELAGTPLDLIARARQAGVELGQAQAEGISAGLRQAQETGERVRVYEEILWGPLLKAAGAADQADAVALRVAEALAKRGRTTGEQFAGGMAAGLQRLEQSFGTFGENVSRLVEGMGQTWARGLDDLFFSAVTGKFKELPNVARQMGLGVVRELTGAFSRLTTQTLLRGLEGLFGPRAGSLAGVVPTGAGGVGGGILPGGGGLDVLTQILGGGGAASSTGIPYLGAGAAGFEGAFTYGMGGLGRAPAAPGPLAGFGGAVGAVGGIAGTALLAYGAVTAATPTQAVVSGIGAGLAAGMAASQLGAAVAATTVIGIVVAIGLIIAGLIGSRAKKRRAEEQRLRAGTAAHLQQIEAALPSLATEELVWLAAAMDDQLGARPYNEIRAPTERLQQLLTGTNPINGQRYEWHALRLRKTLPGILTAHQLAPSQWESLRAAIAAELLRRETQLRMGAEAAPFGLVVRDVAPGGVSRALVLATTGAGAGAALATARARASSAEFILDTLGDPSVMERLYRMITVTADQIGLTVRRVHPYQAPGFLDNPPNVPLGPAPGASFPPLGAPPPPVSATTYTPPPPPPPPQPADPWTAGGFQTGEPSPWSK